MIQMGFDWGSFLQQVVALFLATYFGAKHGTQAGTNGSTDSSGK